MKDYKDTLLMGKTNFEMRGNLGQKEPLIQEKWNQENRSACRRSNPGSWMYDRLWKQCKSRRWKHGCPDGYSEDGGKHLHGKAGKRFGRELYG